MPPFFEPPALRPAIVFARGEKTRVLPRRRQAMVEENHERPSPIRRRIVIERPQIEKAGTQPSNWGETVDLVEPRK